MIAMRTEIGHVFLSTSLYNFVRIDIYRDPVQGLSQAITLRIFITARVSGCPGMVFYAVRRVSNKFRKFRLE